ncbi:uncharacterized protein LOC123505001 [Portunus trituberculatus]|uniref:uncharacterized protein LOC123505001 n=1 Tax=Portunus trituberculatus TaxID=210409 RepID=UPI001E1CEEC7|nr:uncharacterized protein LOC123505001 [Portunus trituberculatus]
MALRAFCLLPLIFIVSASLLRQVAPQQLGGYRAKRHVLVTVRTRLTPGALQSVRVEDKVTRARLRRGVVIIDLHTVVVFPQALCLAFGEEACLLARVRVDTAFLVYHVPAQRHARRRAVTLSCVHVKVLTIPTLTRDDRYFIWFLAVEELPAVCGVLYLLAYFSYCCSRDGSGSKQTHPHHTSPHQSTVHQQDTS